MHSAPLILRIADWHIQKLDSKHVQLPGDLHKPLSLLLLNATALTHMQGWPLTGTGWWWRVSMLLFTCSHAVAKQYQTCMALTAPTASVMQLIAALHAHVQGTQVASTRSGMKAGKAALSS